MISDTRMRYRIFLADEEYVLASMLADLLRQQGWDARAFRSPYEALEAAYSAPPDLLVCDVEIPQLSSMEFAMRMRRRSPGCKVLLFSTHSGTNSLLESIRSTAKDFILLFGPAHLNQLLDEIHIAMDHPHFQITEQLARFAHPA
jgi:DNA-binding NtrC family response regulator